MPVYNVRPISISDTVSDGATKTLVLKLKAYSMSNCPKEFESNAINTLCAMRALKFEILQRMYELNSALATQKFCII